MSRTVTVEGSAGRSRKAALQYVRCAVTENELTRSIQKDNDTLDRNIEYTIYVLLQSQPTDCNIDVINEGISDDAEDDYVSSDDEPMFQNSSEETSIDPELLTHYPSELTIEDGIHNDQPVEPDSSVSPTQNEARSTHLMTTRSQITARNLESNAI